MHLVISVSVYIQESVGTGYYFFCCIEYIFKGFFYSAHFFLKDQSPIRKICLLI